MSGFDAVPTSDVTNARPGLTPRSRARRPCAPEDALQSVRAPSTMSDGAARNAEDDPSGADGQERHRSWSRRRADRHRAASITATPAPIASHDGPSAAQGASGSGRATSSSERERDGGRRARMADNDCGGWTARTYLSGAYSNLERGGAGRRPAARPNRPNAAAVAQVHDRRRHGPPRRGWLRRRRPPATGRLIRRGVSRHEARELLYLMLHAADPGLVRAGSGRPARRPQDRVARDIARRRRGHLHATTVRSSSPVVRAGPDRRGACTPSGGRAGAGGALAIGASGRPRASARSEQSAPHRPLAAVGARARLIWYARPTVDEHEAGRPWRRRAAPAAAAVQQRRPAVGGACSTENVCHGARTTRNGRRGRTGTPRTASCARNARLDGGPAPRRRLSSNPRH